MVFSINVGSGVIEADFVMATLNPEGLSTDAKSNSLASRSSYTISGASISSQKIASLEPNNASQESSGESDSEDEETRQLRKSKKLRVGASREVSAI